eukprot:gene8457-17433_t
MSIGITACLLSVLIFSLFDTFKSKKFLNTKEDFDELIKYAYSIAPNPDGIQNRAILAAQNYTIGPSVKKPLLCAVFLSTSKSSIELLEANMRYTGQECDWAAIAYAGDESRLVRVKGRSSAWNSTLIHYSVESDNIDTNPSTSSYTIPINISQEHSSITTRNISFKHIPKPLLYYRLLPYLPNYERVWLLDEDMSLKDFNIKQFFHILNCYAYPKPPMLVAQALVAENTQYFKSFNHKSWEKIQIIAMAVGYIEQQAPIIDATFFHWFINYIVTPLVDVVRVLGSDWSFDDSWCRAAASFSKDAYGHKSIYPESCLLVIKGTPIHHLNSKKLHYLHLRRNEFGRVGTALRNITGTLFPLWMVSGYKTVDALHPKDRKEARRGIAALPLSCPL